MFSHSLKSHLQWSNSVGFNVRLLCKTRWWSRWEVINQILELFGEIEPFLIENDDLAPRTKQKMINILQDPTNNAYLQVEMAAVVDAGREFVKSTYKLEGDGPLVLDCYECLQTVLASIHVSNFPNVDAIIKTISADHNSQQRLKLHALACVKPGLDYFISKYTGDLSKQISTFQAARLFVPHKIVQLSPTAATVDSLSSFPFTRPSPTCFKD